MEKSKHLKGYKFGAPHQWVTFLFTTKRFYHFPVSFIKISKRSHSAPRESISEVFSITRDFDLFEINF